MKSPRAVCFDLDATLVQLTPDGYSVALDRVYKALALRRPQLDIKLLDLVDVKLRAHWHDWESNIPEGASGLDAMRMVWNECLTDVGYDIPNIGDFAVELYWELIHTRPLVLQPFDDVFELLNALSGRFRLAVITNGPRDLQYDKLATCGLDQYFDVFVASGDVGSPKPNATIFKHTLGLLGISADQALHVGDHLIADIGGAMRVGIRSIWLNRDRIAKKHGDPQPNFEITSLSELTSIIDGM